jgi:hypothetical protein
MLVPEKSANLIEVKRAPEIANTQRILPMHRLVHYQVPQQQLQQLQFRRGPRALYS